MGFHHISKFLCSISCICRMNCIGFQLSFFCFSFIFLCRLGGSATCTVISHCGMALLLPFMSALHLLQLFPSFYPLLGSPLCKGASSRKRTRYRYDCIL